MNSHLVSVKICVKCGTDEGVELDGLAFNKNRFKSLNPQSVEGGCSIKQNGVFSHNFI